MYEIEKVELNPRIVERKGLGLETERRPIDKAKKRRLIETMKALEVGESFVVPGFDYSYVTVRARVCEFNNDLGRDHTVLVTKWDKAANGTRVTCYYEPRRKARLENTPYQKEKADDSI